MGRNVDVTPDHPLNITDSDRDFGIVTIKPGGQIFVMTSAKITIEKLVKSGPTAALAYEPNAGITSARALAALTGQTTPDISIMGATGNPGTNGQNGPAGKDGVAGENANCNWASGCWEGSAGTDGSQGGNAGNASNGTDGGNTLPANMSVKALSGTVFIASGGGLGGVGGNGGNGGNGGKGGKGGNGSSDGAYSRPGYAGGNGANGGNGGAGGNGGNGGNGALVTIRYGTMDNKDSQFVPTAISADPGAGGSGGVGGSGGDGGAGGTGGGKNGAPGSSGNDGKAGSKGSSAGQPSTFDIQQGTL